MVHQVQYSQERQQALEQERLAKLKEEDKAKAEVSGRLLCVCV